MKRKSTKVLFDGKETGLRVEEYRQEDDPSWLAERLAEHLMSARNCQNDYSAFLEAAQAERRKAIQLQHVLFQLQQVEKGLIAKPTSRMDPLNTYDKEACETQLKDLQDNAVDLQGRADDMDAKRRYHEAEAEKVQRKIIKLRSSN